MYDVEEIIGYKVVNGKEKYRVKWENFSYEESTWEPIENLFNVMDKVEEFMSKRAELTRSIQSKRGKI